MDAAQIIDAREEQRVTSMIRGDTDVLRDLLSPDLLWVHSSGKSDNRDAFLARLDSGNTRYLKIERSDVSITELGDAALVTGFAEMIAEVGGQRKDILNRYCNLWRKSAEGDWQMTYWQSTSAT